MTRTPSRRPPPCWWRRFRIGRQPTRWRGMRSPRRSSQTASVSRRAMGPRSLAGSARFRRIATPGSCIPSWCEKTRAASGSAGHWSPRWRSASTSAGRSRSTCHGRRRPGASAGGVDLFPGVLSHASALTVIDHAAGFRRRGFEVVGLIPNANGRGQPDVLMAKQVSTDT